MVFTVIEGGAVRDQSAAAIDARPSRSDVEREATRRLMAINYQMWERREAVAGMPIPREVRYLAMQVRFAAQAIAALERIPPDFRSDCYWPPLDQASAFRTGP